MTGSSGIAGLGAYLLVVVGTLGLLANEFLLDWGRSATVVFALLNVAGLVGVGFALLARK